MCLVTVVLCCSLGWLGSMTEMQCVLPAIANSESDLIFLLSVICWEQLLIAVVIIGAVRVRGKVWSMTISET